MWIYLNFFFVRSFVRFSSLTTTTTTIMIGFFFLFGKWNIYSGGEKKTKFMKYRELKIHYVDLIFFFSFFFSRLLLKRNDDKKKFIKFAFSKMIRLKQWNKKKIFNLKKKPKCRWANQKKKKKFCKNSAYMSPYSILFFISLTKTEYKKIVQKKFFSLTCWICIE